MTNETATAATPARRMEMNPSVRDVARLMSIGVLVSALLAACTTSTVVRREQRDTRAPAATRPAPPKPGSVATVRKGDTLYAIATRHGLSPLDLATWNQIAPPYTIYPGQRLRLSPPGEPPRTASSSGSTSKPPTQASTQRPAAGTTASKPAGKPVDKPSNKPSNKPTDSAASGTTGVAPKPPAAGSTPTPVAPPTAAPPTSAFAWQWPADGALLQRYAAGDPTRQGIAIAGKNGDTVRAAADGIVVYSGAGLIGYGELIIVKHDEQWLSAYAHNRARLVNEGQRVKAGERIAELGRSGAAREMLRFEIRYNGRPLDPLLYLPKR